MHHPKILFVRPRRYLIRMQKNYGHFLRDNVLYIYYFLKKAKLLDKEYELYISTIRYGFHHEGFKKFLLDIFPRAKILTAPNRCNKWEIPEEERLLIEGARRISPPSTLRRHWDGNKFLSYRTEALLHYPKYCVDDFRDYCFKQYNFKPKVKKRILYVPRQESDQPSPRPRFLKDKALIKELKTLCETSGYELLEWVNNVSVFEQMKAYSESEIIIGVQGTDWINSFWANSEQFLLEIIPPKKQASCDQFHYPFDLNAMFYSKHLLKYAEQSQLSKWYKFNPDQERNWDVIVPPPNQKTIMSNSGKKELIKKIQSYISLSKDSS